MNSDERIGYTEWLHSNGMVCIAESNKQFNGSARDSGSIYVFRDHKSAVDIIKKIHALDNKPASQGSQDLFDYYKDKTSIAYPTGMKSSQGYVEVYVTTEIRDKLSKCYMKEVHPNISEQEKAEQLEAVRTALEKIDGVNANLPAFQDARRDQQYDILGRAAQLLRNKISGWKADLSFEALLTGLQIYLAENYLVLTESERNKITEIMKLFIGQDADYKMLSGVVNDATFSQHLKVIYWNVPERDFVIEKYMHQLLYGGECGTFEYFFRKMKGDTNTVDGISYKQPSFFGGKDGTQPQTNRLIFHAGGAYGHTAYRVLMRVKDSSAIGGAKYLYTKIDGGFNMEVINDIFYPIYTTEITPKYKKVGDAFIELTEAEMKTKDPKVYQEYIEATIKVLVAAEKGIECYKKSSNTQTGNAQGESFAAFDSEEGKRWTILNDLITKATGNKVVNLVPIIPFQRSGNCALFSAFLLFATLMAMDENGLVNRERVDITLDFLQQAKTYKHHSVVYNLSEIERKDQDLIVMRDVMEAARKNLKYEGRDPIEWAMLNKITFKGLHPIEWAMAENTKIYKGHKTGNKILIDGSTPFVYAMERRNVLTIQGKNFIDYYTRYRLQSKDELLTELTDSKIDISAYFSNIYNTIFFNDVKDMRLIRLNDLYRGLIEAKGDALLSQNSQFAQMISNVDIDVRIIAYEMQRMKVDPDTLLNLQKVSDLTMRTRIDLVAAWMKTTIPQPPEHLITNEIKNGVANFAVCLRESEVLNVLTKANKDHFVTLAHAEQYIAELRARPELYSKYHREVDAWVNSVRNVDNQNNTVKQAKANLIELEVAKDSMTTKEYKGKISEARAAVTIAERELENAVNNRTAMLKAISPGNKIKLVYHVENYTKTCLGREEMILREGKEPNLEVYTSAIEKAFNEERAFAGNISAAAKEMFEALEGIRKMPKGSNWADKAQDEKQSQVPGSERG